MIAVECMRDRAAGDHCNGDPRRARRGLVPRAEQLFDRRAESPREREREHDGGLRPGALTRADSLSRDAGRPRELALRKAAFLAQRLQPGGVYCGHRATIVAYEAANSSGTAAR